MRNFFKLALPILIIIAVIVLVKQPPAPIHTTASSPVNNITPAAVTAEIKVNPLNKKQLRNPFTALDSLKTPTGVVGATLPYLNGIIRSGDEYLAMLTLNGHTEAYKLHKQIGIYQISHITPTMVTLYNIQTKRTLSLKIED